MTPIDGIALPASFPIDERVFSLWEKLASFGSARIDDAVQHLLGSLCLETGAQNAFWLGSVRLDSLAKDDSIHGWRPLRYVHYDPSEETAQTCRRIVRQIDAGESPASIELATRAAGRFRMYAVRSWMPDDFFESEFYQRMYARRGIFDYMFIAVPINEDVESIIGLQRYDGYGAFTLEQVQRAGLVVRGIPWLHRQALLSHGLLIAETPLSPGERRVLHQLLAGQSEKEMAGQLGLSKATVHDYVKAIYRKFAVASRPELTALWLGAE